MPHILLRGKNKQHAVVVANWIVEVAGQKSARLKARFHLHAERRVGQLPAEHTLVVFLGGERRLQRAIAGNHSGRDLAFQPKTPHQFLASRVERAADAASAILRMRADVRAVEPLPAPLMRSQPPSGNHFGEGMVHVVQVEVQTQRGCRADHAVAVQHHHLPRREQLDVLAIVHRLESLFIGQRRKADHLQLLQLLAVPGLRIHEDKAPG